MKQFILFIAFALLIHINTFSQDRIIKTTGEEIECKIVNQDSTSVYFVTDINGKSVNTLISRSHIRSIEYNVPKSTRPYFIDGASFGLGIGLDYGGFGANILLYPASNLGLFVGAGYALAGIGMNGGLKYRFISKEKFRKFVPYLTAMYGYNAAIVVMDGDKYNKFFYGPTFGFGFDFKSRPEKKGYWTMALLIPVRSSEVGEYMDNLEDNHDIVFKNEMIPIAISFGYRLIIR